MDEARIKRNARCIQIFLDDVVNYSNSVLLEVYGKLQQTGAPSFPGDPRQALAKDVLEQAFGAVLDHVGAPNVIAILLGFNSSYVAIPPPSLGQDFSDIALRFRATFLQMRGDMARIYDDPVGRAADVYPLPYPLPGTGAREFRVSDLETGDFPDYGSVAFNDLLLVFNQAFRHQITRVEMVKHFKVGFPYFIAQTRTDLRDPAVDDQLNMRDWWLTRSQPSSNSLYSRVPLASYGVPGRIPNQRTDSSRQAFEATCRMFYQLMPGTFVCDTPEDSEGRFWYKQYVLVGSQTPYRTRYWALFSSATKDDAYALDRWLFMDDGFGTILNSNGVARRRDVFLHWGLQGSGGMAG